MKNEKGITLITLTVTIVIILILCFSVTANVGQYNNEKRKANFEIDIQRIKEEIDHYYAITDELPILNKYTYISMLGESINKNDNDNYYVIDLSKLYINLYYGKDYNNISKLNITDDVSNYLDVYIINEQSHTIYYPKGIEYNGEIHYTVENLF